MINTYPKEKTSINEHLLLQTKNKTPWHLPMFQGFCIALPLLIGLLIAKFNYGYLASLASVAILYYPINTSRAKSMIYMCSCSLGLIIAFCIGLVFSFDWILACLVFGISSFGIHFLVCFYNLHQPKSLFFIMLSSIAFCSPFNEEEIPLKIGIIVYGVIQSCILACIYSFIFKSSKSEDIEHKKNINIKESLVVGIFMGVSLLIGMLLELEKPYWIPISCLSIMLGLNFSHVKKRSIHRIIGTLLGLGATWLLNPFISNPFTACFALIILHFILGNLLAENYLYAVIAITPFTILLADINPCNIVISVETMSFRFINIFIGSTLGVIAGGILHYQKNLNSPIKT